VFCVQIGGVDGEYQVKQNAVLLIFRLFIQIGAEVEQISPSGR